ncbi:MULTISPECIES: GNAT family N-acetyltransferase [unclassified Dysgonomonas]|uniref:GNAT family N-acetyltransferase n=1 Tax=unclassified Dysgonomonas TaxID=2630389 RepID=UPI0013EC5ED5|nr:MULTISPECIES: GNAT family N-acetyltransferase [unclassified Dysgonomonas]
MKQFEKVNLDSLKEFREGYFNSIVFAQELFIEWMVAKGECYLIIDNQEMIRKVIGYYIISEDHILIEFYLVPNSLTQKEKIFKQIIIEKSISKAYCKSFDPILLACCHTFSESNNVIGTLFRDYLLNTYIKLDSNISVRLAKEGDINFLLTFDSDLYETPEELRFTVSNKALYMFEKEKELIGCGYLIRILPDKKDYDIGMWVNPEFRKQGYATQIIAYLKEYCLLHGYRSICGCAVENIASRRTLEKNGFVSKYCLLEFDFQTILLK